MNKWSKVELDAIAASDDLHISPFRDDGVTYGTPTWIWSVVVGNSLYVRAYNGQKSRWYRAAMQQRAGRITAAGLQRDVRFGPADVSHKAALDAAYKAKYSSSSYLKPMTSARAQSATVEISPTVVPLAANTFRTYL